MADRVLPAGFEDLSGFVAKWSKPTERERNHARLASEMPELQKFYDDMAPHMDAAVDYLNGFKVGEMPRDAQNLFELALSFMEVSHAVEVWGTPDIDDAFPADRMTYLLDR